MIYEQEANNVSPALEPTDDQPARRPLSEAKLRANQLNAQHATGPRSEDGKKRSSLNALRNGIHAQITCLTAEDLAAFNQICGSIREELEPRGARENLLAQSIAECHFRMARIRAVENSLFAAGYRAHVDSVESGHPEVDTALSAADTWAEQHKQLLNLSIYEGRLSRLCQRQNEELNQLQAVRKAAYQRAEAQAMLLARHAQAKGEEYDGEDDFEPASAHGGFVFSLPSLARQWNREIRLKQAEAWDRDCRAGRNPAHPASKTGQGAPGLDQAA